MDHFDPWQVVPRQVFTPYSRLLISVAFVVASCIGCLMVTGVIHDIYYFCKGENFGDFPYASLGNETLPKKVNPFNPIALRKMKMAYNFGLFECNRVK